MRDLAAIRARTEQRVRDEIAVEKRRARVIYPRIYTLLRHLPNLARWITDRFTPPARPV